MFASACTQARSGCCGALHRAAEGRGAALASDSPGYTSCLSPCTRTYFRGQAQAPKQLTVCCGRTYSAARLTPAARRPVWHATLQPGCHVYHWQACHMVVAVRGRWRACCGGCGACRLTTWRPSACRTRAASACLACSARSGALPRSRCPRHPRGRPSRSRTSRAGACRTGAAGALPPAAGALGTAGR